MDAALGCDDRRAAFDGTGVPAGARAHTSVNVLGVDVTTHSLTRVAAEVVQWAGAPPDATAPCYVCATSVHGLMEGIRDPEFQSILNRAARVVADGMPLVWFGRLRGFRAMQRVRGPSLMWEVCRLSAGLRVRHYFYGGAPGVAVELVRRLQAQHPGLQIAGVYCPPFRPLSESELHDVAERINASGADIVWVGLSTPKQERWIHGAIGLLKARVLVSVGAAFDFHAGRVRQAPSWMQQTGLEWFFRLLQEPGRLWRRYAINNPVFVVLASLQLAGLKRFDSSNGQGGRVNAA